MVPIAFRSLTREDFPLVGRWLAQPLVACWWADDGSPAALEAQYGPVVDGTDRTEVFIAVVDGKAGGLIQRYRWDDEAAYIAEVSPHVEIPPGAMSIDYLLGDKARGQGRGTATIGAFVARLWRDHPECPCVIVPVHAKNLASWRALERNDFTRIAECELEPDNPAHSRDHVVYRLNRPR